MYENLAGLSPELAEVASLVQKKHQITQYNSLSSRVCFIYLFIYSSLGLADSAS